jgi:hypothetical protein
LVLHTCIAENIVDSLPALSARNVIESGEKIEILARRETGKEGSLGSHGNAHLPPHLASVAKCVELADTHRARIRQKHGGNQLEGGGLSATVWAEQDQNLGSGNREGDIVERHGFTAPLPSKPVEQCRAMTKYLANGLEDYLLLRRWQDSVL